MCEDEYTSSSAAAELEAVRQHGSNMSEDFTRRFSIQVGQEEARRRFINRALNDLFEEYVGVNALMAHADVFEVARIESAISSALGERHIAGQVRDFICRSFMDCLRSIEALYSAFPNKEHIQRSIDSTIRRLVSEAEVDIAVRWAEGKFFPSGAKQLDDELVNEPLRWLDDPNLSSIREPYAKAIKHYLESMDSPEKLSDTGTDLYEALEAAAKLVTQRESKDLSANAELFTSKLNLSRHFGQILKNYIEFANQFRHAAAPGKPRGIPSRNEVEAFLYLTGIFLRLVQQWHGN